MLTITDVLAVPATGGYFADDQAAIKAGAVRDGVAYPPGVRAPAEAVSLLLVLSDGYVAHGDCVSVQYSGVGGREPRLRAAELSARLMRELGRRCAARPVPSFLDTDALVDGPPPATGSRRRCWTPPRTPAGTTMAEVVATEWGLTHAFRPIPVYAQTGEERRANVDKMILKQVDSLPHGLINTPELARELVPYVRWVRDRVLHLRASEAYVPILHFDVYGLLGDERGAGDPRAGRGRRGRSRCASSTRSTRARVTRRSPAWPRCASASPAARRSSPTSGPTRVDDIRAFNAAGAADVMQIKAPDLGSVGHVVDAVLDCKAHGVVAHIGGSCSRDRALGAGHRAPRARRGRRPAAGQARDGRSTRAPIVRNELARDARARGREKSARGGAGGAAGEGGPDSGAAASDRRRITLPE